MIKSDSTVETRTVSIASLYGDLAVVAQGVQPGEKVVTDGQLQLVSGTRVEAKGGEVPKNPIQNDPTKKGGENTK